MGVKKSECFDGLNITDQENLLECSTVRPKLSKGKRRVSNAR
jgi:hypothetical protein